MYCNMLTVEKLIPVYDSENVYKLNKHIIMTHKCCHIKINNCFMYYFILLGTHVLTHCTKCFILHPLKKVRIALGYNSKGRV